MVDEIWSSTISALLIIALLVACVLFQTQISRQSAETKSAHEQLRKIEKAVTRAEWRAGEDARNLGKLLRRELERPEPNSVAVDKKTVRTMQSDLSRILNCQIEGPHSFRPSEREVERLLLLILSETVHGSSN